MTDVSNTNADEVGTLLSILTDEHTHLRDLTQLQLENTLRSLAGYPSGVPGNLHSRLVAPEFFRVLQVWLVRTVNCTDQQVHELLFDCPGAYCDQYKPWSPEWSFPLSNDEVRDIASFDSWDKLVDDIQEAHKAPTHEGRRLASLFYIAFGEDPTGELCWLERNGQGTTAAAGELDYPKFTLADFEALKRSYTLLT